MKTETLKIRVTPEEKRAFEDAADVTGASLSAWIRQRLRRAARSDLEDLDRPIAFLVDVKME